MSDGMNQMPPEAPPLDGGKKKGFFGTTAGKWVAIVGGLGVVGILLGVAVALIFSFTSGQPSGTVDKQSQQSGSKASTSSTATVEVKSPAAVLANSSLFTFRDIFDPLVASTSDSTATVTPGAEETSDTVTPTENGVLYLDGIVTENGVLKAQLRWNGVAYTLGAGEAIPGSPWEVLRVTSTSVTMLYGDVQVTLSVGQGITK